MRIAVGVLLVVMGVGIAGIWTRDIVAGEQVDLSQGFFAARDEDAGSLMWLHWLAEYATAATLTVAGVALLADAEWARVLAAVGAGALLYTSTNSLGWAFARRDRLAYAIPMLFGVVVGLVAAGYLVTTM